jgi:phenylalanyl-tRNA synthetase beta chain
MRVSKEWLNEWVEVSESSSSELAESLTMAGLEVDDVEKAAGDFSKVVVGQVLSVEPHPDANKLCLCQVEVGEEHPLPIVCGASNVVAEAKVAVALVGARLGDLKIAKTKLRGEPSHGMLCAKEELGLEKEEDGIWLLPQEAPIGCPLKEYLKLNDEILVVELTPNRGDCLSMHGVAREVAALKNISLKKEAVFTDESVLSDKTLPISIQEEAFCPQYVGRVIEDLSLETPSPIWLKERLRRAGIRAKSLVVDVTNYVMLEVGQPMHAFDLETINDEIIIRRALPGERLTLLNDKDVLLEQDTVVLADRVKALAIAGVMGGHQSAVSEKTKHVFLESAYFAKEKIAGSARRYGLATDSSHRFERGVAPELQRKAILRATELLVSIAGGKPGPVIEKNSESLLPSEKSISFSTQQANRVLGCCFSEQEVTQIFERLGMSVQSQGESLQVVVPAFRFDIEIEADLVEELARVYGYNNLPTSPIVAPFHANNTLESTRSKLDLANRLVALGYNEIISYSFVCPNLQRSFYGDEAGLRLLNPISSELSEMRKGLWPGLMSSALFNLHRQESSMKLFEMGLVFQKDGNELKQLPMLGGLLVGEHAASWHGGESFDFYDLKGDVESIIGKELLSRFEFRSCSHPALHPGQSAKLYCLGKPVGYLGALHPKLLKEHGISHKCFLFEIEQSALCDGVLPKFQKISKYPLIRRDLSFIVDKSIKFVELSRAIEEIEQAEPFFQSCEIFDLYTGDGIPDGQKSIAISVVLQHPHRTLVDDEVNLFIDAILKKLEHDFNIILRE